MHTQECSVVVGMHKGEGRCEHGPMHREGRETAIVRLLQTLWLECLWCGHVQLHYDAQDG